MKEITLKIPDNKYPFFLELLKNLDFVAFLDDSDLSEDQIKFINGTKQSLKEVEQHINGEIQLKTAEELLHEL